MIQAVNLTKEFSSRVLFKDVSFTIGKGEKVALVGRNGCGKSTLFRIILGEHSPSEGEIQVPKNYKLSHLEQHIHFTEPNLLQECCKVLPKEREFEGYKAEKILFGLGFTQDDLEKDPKSFSGGFQLRINLCKALLVEPDMLLLDEPTNYLDITSIRWLKRFLRQFSGEMVIISHEKDFLDDVCTHTMGIFRGRLLKVKGDTSKYYEILAQEDEVYEKTRQNIERKKKEMQRFVERFRAKASKATQAQSKLKQLEKMESLDERQNESTFNLGFRYKECPAKFIGKVENLSFGYKENELLINNLNLTLKADDKIAIIGQNGKGKSTLLNLIAKELTPNAGEITTHNAIEMGYFGQTNIARLHENNTILQEIMSEGFDVSNEVARSLAGAMLFTGDLVDKKIKVLSGGEKSRVLLAKIMAKDCNLLLLDEPTNHLDQESIDELIDEMNCFLGAVILVTHSEYILKKFATKLIIFREGNATEFLGTYDEFLEKIGWDDESRGDSSLPNSAISNESIKLSRKDYKIKRQELIKARGRELKPLKEIIERNEESIMNFEESIENWNQELVVASEAQDGDKIHELSQKVAKAHDEIDRLFLELEEATETSTQIEERYQQELSSLEDLI